MQTIGLVLNFLNPLLKLNFQNLSESYDCSFIKLQMQIWTFYMLSTLLNSILSLPIWQMGKPVFRVKVFIKKLFSTFKYTFEFNKPLRSVWYYFHKNLIFHSWVTSVEVVFLVAWSYLSREIYIYLSGKIMDEHLFFVTFCNFLFNDQKLIKNNGNDVLGELSSNPVSESW